jgi:hypothetical protein
MMDAKGLNLCKRARPDTQLTIAVLCTKVKDSNKADWGKLAVRLMRHMSGAKRKRLTLSAGDPCCVKWHVDTSFAVHPDFKSRAGATVSFDDGKGAVQSISRKQKLDEKSSTEAELVGVDNMSVMMLWTKLFLEEQGYKIERNVPCQDNKNAVLLEEKGKKSSGNRTLALSICCFFMTDQVQKGNVIIKHCPTDDDVIGAFHTKPLQGKKFCVLLDSTILGIWTGTEQRLSLWRLQIAAARTQNPKQWHHQQDEQRTLLHRCESGSWRRGTTIESLSCMQMQDWWNQGMERKERPAKMPCMWQLLTLHEEWTVGESCDDCQERGCQSSHVILICNQRILASVAIAQLLEWGHKTGKADRCTHTRMNRLQVLGIDNFNSAVRRCFPLQGHQANEDAIAEDICIQEMGMKHCAAMHW